ncbi:MAG: S46 family peptidase [Bacteroidota bacterium]
MKKTLLALLIASFSHLSFAGEGMWLPLLLKSLNEAEMQSMGMKMTAEDIYSVNQGSLKDAIVHFGGFCTSELISGEGLLLTNHHCGYGNIQSHSSVTNNYLKEGFWAASRGDELPNPGLTATFIVRIEDVTEAVLMGVGRKMDAKTRQSTIDKNIAALVDKTPLGQHEEVKVRPFFHGNQYFLFVTMTYEDVRLVGAPPESIGKFGSDTDNWVWPRHTGDFSLFRIYAAPDNMPAAYSENNVPFRPKHFLPISLDGVAEDDFTMVFGFPGRTNEYLPSYGVQQIMDVLDPAKIAIRDRALKIVDVEMRADEAVRIQYASKYARIANYWKKWIGEVQGLKTTNALGKKREFERAFDTRIHQEKKWHDIYHDILPDFERLYRQIEPYALVRDYYNEVVGRNVELLRVMGAMRRLAGYVEKDDRAGYDKYLGRVQGFLKGFYKDYRSEIDQKVFAALIELYFTEVDAQYLGTQALSATKVAQGDYEALAAQLYGSSMATQQDKVEALLAQDWKQVAAQLQADPLYQFTTSLSEAYETKVAPEYNALNEQIRELQRTYMKAMMEVFPNERFYPDANSTLRVTYGQVKGYTPSDTVSYDFMTYLSGVMAKYKPGDYEFDVSPKLTELYRKKDYGEYADAEGRMPVCFIGSNHTTGGNSGSPAIDAYGNLIGLNFDRVWEGTMSDINYDASICRNIMVDIRYVLFIIDKFADAGHLIEEMELVYPKTEGQLESGEASEQEDAARMKRNETNRQTKKQLNKKGSPIKNQLMEAGGGK